MRSRPWSECMNEPEDAVCCRLIIRVAGTVTFPDYFKKSSRTVCSFFKSGRLTYIMWPASKVA